MEQKRVKSIQRLYQAGQALVRQHKYDQAITRFRRITGSDVHTLPLPGGIPDTGPAEEGGNPALRAVFLQAHVSLAVCYSEKGMFQEAISVLNRATQIDPDNVDTLCALGWVYRRNGMLDQAVEAFEQALQRNPRCARAQKSLASLAMQQGRYDDAIALCRRAVEADPENSQAHIELSHALQEAGRHSEALDVVRRAVTLDGANLEHLLRAITLLREGGFREDALLGLEWAVTICEEPAVRLALAECYLDLDRNREATEECQRVLRTRPRDLRALDLLQTAFLKEGDMRPALRIAYRQALLCPLDPMNFFRMAVLHQQLGDIRQAMDNYERVVSMEDAYGADLADRAREALDMLDGLQLRQVLMLASDDPVFRARLNRDPQGAAAQRGFFLSESGLAMLQHLELDRLPAMQMAWLRKTYH